MMATRLRLSADTLLLIPCSKSKRREASSRDGQSILSSLDSDLASALRSARSALKATAAVDEDTLTSAYLRYSGELYEHGAKALCQAVEEGQHVLIISGGYGVLTAEEPIGWYEREFRLQDWPSDLLDRCILNYVVRARVRSVLAIMPNTGNYVRLIRRIKWAEAGIKASIVCPIARGGGAMRKVPRAQGQAVTELIAAGIDPSWRSSDSLGLKFETL